MLRKKEVYTTITPIPGFIPRQLAIDILHSHSEVITLNPLVLEHKPIPAPRNAASDEFYSTWYEIIERIQYIPGIGRMGSGKISFNGCFHDTTWGLQTHIYAPMSVDLRNAYRIGGNQPGVEPPDPPEIGMAELGIPSDGLYLREDIEIRCNIAVVGFVKSQLKVASKEMVRRIIKKAELLDAGVLKAMIQDGRLRTINPNDLSASPVLPGSGPSGSAPGTPYLQQPPLSPRFAPQYPMQGGGGFQSLRRPHAAEPPPHEMAAAPVEMPGDFYHPQPSPPFRHNASRDSNASRYSRQSAQMIDPRSYYRSSTPQSEGQQAQSPPGSGYGSPGMDHQGFAAELAARPEARDHGKAGYHYDPRDFAHAKGPAG